MTSNDLAIIPLTMSSLEIAGLVQKRHDNVLRDIRAMANELGLSLSFEEKGETGGRPLTVANLPKRECLILVSGYSTELRARIIDRWMQLEAALASADAGQSSMPEPYAEFIRRTDGIARQLMHKVTESEKIIAEMGRSIPVIVSRTVEAAIASDTRRAVLDYVSVRQLLDEAKAIQRKRNSVNRKIGYELATLDRLANSPSLRRQCPHSGVWLYPRSFADAYMKAHGIGHVKAHNDRVMGQSVLKLVPMKPQASAL